MRFRAFWISLGGALLLLACSAPKVLTPVELKEKELSDLNATIHANGKQLETIRSQQLLLPKGSPGYLAVGREVALLMEQSSNLALEWEGKTQELAEARRVAAESAMAATNAPVIPPAITLPVAPAGPVLSRGELDLFPFTFAADTDQGITTVTGEVANTGTNALADVSIVFNVLDSDDEIIGTVSDQTATLVPGVRWAFKALVLDNTAVKAEFLEFKVEGNSVPESNPDPMPLTTPPAPGR